MDKRTKELRSAAKILQPILQLGKNGLTQGSIDLIDRELESKQLIKLKIKGALSENASKTDREALAQQIAHATGSQVIELIGNTLVLYRA